MHHGPLGAVLDAGCVPSSQSQGVHIFAFTSHLYRCTLSSSNNLFFSLGFIKITALPEINPPTHYTWGQIRIHCWVPRSPRRPSPSLPIGLQSLQEVMLLLDPRPLGTLLLLPGLPRHTPTPPFTQCLSSLPTKLDSYFLSTLASRRLLLLSLSPCPLRHTASGPLSQPPVSLLRICFLPISPLVEGDRHLYCVSALVLAYAILFSLHNNCEFQTRKPRHDEDKRLPQEPTETELEPTGLASLRFTVWVGPHPGVELSCPSLKIASITSA